MKKSISLIILITFVLTILSFMTSCNNNALYNGKIINGENGKTPTIRINPDTNQFEASYNNGITWTILEGQKTGNVVTLISDDNIYIRSRAWTDTQDFVWHATKSQTGYNGYFNICAAYTCPKDNDPNTLPDLSLWKGCGDDICPVNINYTYIGGNHGFLCVDELTVKEHKKTEKDIGSVWLDSNGNTYCLVKVPDQNTLWMVMFNDYNMSNGIMTSGMPTGTMTHLSNATNTDSIVIESSTVTQLWQCHNNYSLKLFIDGKEKSLDDNIAYYGERCEIITQYDIIYVPAMLQYLMDNVGKNTNDSQHSNDIKESYMTVYVNYQFNKNGSVSTYSSFSVNKNIKVGYLGLVQSMAISETPYTYVPDTIYDKLTLNNGETQDFTKNTWTSDQKCPYRYYQFADASADKGMALVYDRSIGFGKNEIRLPNLIDAGMYYSSKKQYPALISDINLASGQYLDACAVRVPLYKYDDNITSIGWYWIGDDIILMLDSHETVNKDIELPEYMNGYHIEVLDKTNSCNFEQTYIFNNKLRYNCTDYGYLVIRLFK